MSTAPPPERKMSEMISEMAANFISFGKTPEEKDARLTAACSAWNMACMSPELRRQQLGQYVEGYRQFNPATSPSDLADIRKDMESLIERKLKMFPDDLRQIVSAKVVMVGKDYRIEVVSARAQEMLKDKEVKLMAEQPKKLSEMLKEMAERLFRDPDAVPSSEAFNVALMFANIAWNETVGLDNARRGYRSLWKQIEAENTALWNELKTNDVDAMIDELVRFKQENYPDDKRRILACGTTPECKVRVEWMVPVTPGVDSKWEMQLFGLVRMGEREQAMQFLRKTAGMSRKDAAKKVESVAAQIRML
jgi:hypothetical protein